MNIKYIIIIILIVILSMLFVSGIIYKFNSTTPNLPVNEIVPPEETTPIYEIDPLLQETDTDTGNEPVNTEDQSNAEEADQLTLDNITALNEQIAADAAEQALYDSLSTEPVSTEQVSTEQVSTEQVSTEQVSTEPVSTEQVSTEQVVTEEVVDIPYKFPSQIEYIYKQPVPIQDKQMATGFSHSLFIVNENLWVCGRNHNGQLGTDNLINSNIPIKITLGEKNNIRVTLPPVIIVEAGIDHSLFITNDGDLWGMGNYDMLGLGNDPFKIHITIPTFILANVVNVSTKFYHSHIISTDGTVYAMGKNDIKQLGVGANPMFPGKVNQVLNLIADDVVAGKINSHFRLLNGDVISIINGSLFFVRNFIRKICTGINEYSIMLIDMSDNNWLELVSIGFGFNISYIMPNVKNAYNGDKFKVIMTQVAYRDTSEYAKLVQSYQVLYSYTIGILGNTDHFMSGVPGRQIFDSIPIPTSIFGVNECTCIIVGINHILYKTIDDKLWSIGINQYGALGLGHNDNTTEPHQILIS